MKYFVFGEEIEITEMNKPKGSHGSVFEFKTTKSAKKFGLDETFYFQVPNKFSNDYVPFPRVMEMKEAQTENLNLISIFLTKCIWNQELVNQWSEPLI
jgi:hypothetical protein